MLVLKASHEPLGVSDTEDDWKRQPVFQKGAPKNTFIVRLKQFHLWGKYLRVQVQWKKN